jgi:2-polyprenyl-3-methyl-5-hydroxy-6-metoxy-1,4-benzoquinol methylase
MSSNTARFREEVATGQRFAFGKNWRRFLAVLDDDRIAEAERSLREMLGTTTLAGTSFLDVGSGSGLFSLAAKRLGAGRLLSFDYDPQSVTCTSELKRRYFPDAPGWNIEQGSALDGAYLAQLGRWDIVYSWGVLHHTGAMWQALANMVPLVRDDGLLFISIYNDQGRPSRLWWRIKRAYNRSGKLQPALATAFIAYQVVRSFVGDLLKRQNPIRRYRAYRQDRGMSFSHNMIDWLGGYPFEVAKPEAIIDFYHSRGFSLVRLRTVGGGYGCNEYLFAKHREASLPSPPPQVQP